MLLYVSLINPFLCRGWGGEGVWVFETRLTVSRCPRRHFVAQAGLKGNSPASTSYVLGLHDKLSHLTSAEVFPQTYSHKILLCHSIWRHNYNFVCPTFSSDSLTYGKGREVKPSTTFLCK